MVHADLKNFQPTKSIDEYIDDDILWDRIDYGMQYFKDNNSYLSNTNTLAFLGKIKKEE
ncbi:MAG: hypothetical protein ACK5LV_04915 [Lachnospirales bacterium]